MLEYRLLPDNGIDFIYTFVPEPLRGHGIAEKLVRQPDSETPKKRLTCVPTEDRGNKWKVDVSA